MQTHTNHKPSVYQAIYKTHNKSVSSLKALNFDEFPSFEEAFNPISLKKFFHDHDFISPHTASSSHHEGSTAEAQSCTTEVNEMALSPVDHEDQKYKDNMFESQYSESHYNSHYNLMAMSVKSVNKSDKNLEEKESRQDVYAGESQMLSPRSNFTVGVGVNVDGSENVEDVQSVISRFISTLTDNIREVEGMDGKSVKEERMDTEEDEGNMEKGFERLLKAKKVFKIIREHKMEKDAKEEKEKKDESESLNVKRKPLGELLGEETMRVQKVRRLSFKILRDSSNIMKENDNQESENRREKEGKKEKKAKKDEATGKDKKKVKDVKEEKARGEGRKRRKSFKARNGLDEGDNSDA